MTAQGYLKLCLCYDKGIDLRQILRGEETGQNEKNIQKALNEKLTTAMRAAIYKKPAAHCFEHPEEMTEINEMVNWWVVPTKSKECSATGKEQQSGSH